MNKHLLPTLLASLTLALSLSAKEIRLLTIGNSFADSVFVYLPQVVSSAGDAIVMERANIGGCSLEKHWTLAEKSARDPEFKAYPQGKPRYSLQERLRQQPWDVVTIQQASHLSWKPESYQPFASNLQQLVRECAPKAELLIQQTWAYRFDDNRLDPWKIDHQPMYRKLTTAYDHTAADLQIRVTPTGDAVQLARETQPTPYVNSAKALLKPLKYPDKLPSETGSFVNGNRWERIWSLCGIPLSRSQTRELIRKGQPLPDDAVLKLAERPSFLSAKQRDALAKRTPEQPLLTSDWRIGSDRFHLNRRGQYLQALVWYGLLFDKPVANVTFKPGELAQDDADFLKRVAQQAIDRRQRR